jgi:3-hydroxyisobutyrate dehydrogenase-like beta-hydroxyacid dehydrogenase
MAQERPALIGFGEAAQAFAADWGAPATAYDRKTDIPETRGGKIVEAETLSVALAESNAAAVAGATIVLSLVTAGQSLEAAEQTARALGTGTLFLDMNSVSPATKRASAKLIEGCGGRYVDAAIMAPVHPARRGVPLLLSGRHAEAAAAALAHLGFTSAWVIDGGVGRASAIKMIRSVMVKGIEALTAECLIAAEAAGVTDEVVASLDATWPGADWATRGDYNLDRMIVHGRRRAEEMAEVVKTLDELGAGSTMSRGAIGLQRTIGDLALQPPNGLRAKLAALLLSRTNGPPA